MKQKINYLFIVLLILNFVFILPIEEKEDPLNYLENEELNIFQYYYSLQDNSLFLYNIVDYALNNLLSPEIKNNLVDSTKLKTFLKNLLNNYNANTDGGKNKYHNFFHAADVTQNLYIFLKNTKNEYGIFNVTEEYIDLDIFSIIISAVAHDFKHPGRNNNFYRQNKGVPLENELKKFNGQLESYHIQETINLINSNDENNILSKLNETQQKRFFLILNESINSTDNSFNSEKANFLSQYKEVIKANSVNESQEQLKNLSSNLKIDDVKIKLFGCLLHAADISSSTKDYDVYISWSIKVNTEFCNQYKDEVKYNFENFTSCNKNEQEYYKGDKEFIEYIVKVLYDPLCEAFPILGYLCINIENNLNIFTSLLNTK